MEKGDMFCTSGEIISGSDEAGTLDRSAFSGNGRGMKRPLKKTGGRGKKHCKRTQAESSDLDHSEKRRITDFQHMLSQDYILKKIFRKDGPSLGVEFDRVPNGAFGCDSGVNRTRPSDHSTEMGSKRRKASNPRVELERRAAQRKSAPVKKHGLGKGLMTVWRATNPHAKGVPTGLNFAYGHAGNRHASSTPKHHRKLRKSQYQLLAVKQTKLGKKMSDKRKAPMRKRKVLSNKVECQKNASKAGCKLSLEWLRPHERSNALTGLMDDEELELSELQTGPNPLMCSAHLAVSGMHGCSLCKDLLARFPPQSVEMKLPFDGRPWEVDIVKKLFKVFRFLYTHSVAMDMCWFTFDEFVQAFHDKDSALLGKVHMTLLKTLLYDVERELENGFLPRVSKDCRYLQFIQFIKCEEFNIRFWITCLNPLTWTETMRQVLIAAGFGVKQNSLQKQIITKGENRMTTLGLRHGSLKGELFKILYEQGSKGLKVSELAKLSPIVGLNLLGTANQAEELIRLTLSSDVTLFERISSCAYRLRLNPIVSRRSGDCQSDTEDSGSVDDESDNDKDGSSDDSEDSEEFNSEATEKRMVKYTSRQRERISTAIASTEIDESHIGEVWMLGLMESEYSDLSIQEKLNALVALVDLAGGASSLRVEDPLGIISGNVQPHASGGKIKRSTINKHMERPCQDHVGNMYNVKQMHVSGTRPADSGCNGHALQSVYLGSDRRYNSYWLFLGPCSGNDPGHRRVYFESSEDGHWEIIDTQEALCALMSVLDSRGPREAHLLASLEKCEAYLCQMMTDHFKVLNITRPCTNSNNFAADVSNGDGASPVSDVDNSLPTPETADDDLGSSGTIVLELAKGVEEKRQKWDRLQLFDVWLWDSFYLNLSAVKYGKMSFMDSLTRCESCHDLYWRDERHCKTCHSTFELDLDLEERYTVHVATCKEIEDGDHFPKHKVLSSKLQSLKAAAHAIEAVMPEEALVGSWRKSAHKLWVKRLRRTSSLPEFLQVLSDFVGAISEEWLYQSQTLMGPNTAFEEIVAFFPTIPQTTSSVALWLVKLDAVIAPSLAKIASENCTKSLTNCRRISGRHRR